MAMGKSLMALQVEGTVRLADPADRTIVTLAIVPGRNPWLSAVNLCPPGGLNRAGRTFQDQDAVRRPSALRSVFDPTHRQSVLPRHSAGPKTAAQSSEPSAAEARPAHHSRRDK